MVISTLSTSTVQAIGAGQVLADPVALVKELVDNALDARATSVAVQISANTLSSIRVRDNGQGIMPIDRAMVARRHCTSKIVCEDDLRIIGGSSLGFRGEALASAATLSASLTITTRIEGEQAAAVLIIDRSGHVARTEQASPPVGTAVHITDFLVTHPVRKQTSLKCIDKTIKSIKHMLQCYSFARSGVRFSLQVLNAKNEKDNFIYTPTAKDGLEVVALKLFGKSCSSQCELVNMNEGGYHLQAYLPRPNADPSKLNSLGPFISIDARPLSTSKGISRQIVKLFREILKRAGNTFDKVKDPFICLEISCPTGSYDINIEPAKDDVLFEDADLVIELIEKLFQKCYPCDKDRTGSFGSRQQILCPRAKDPTMIAKTCSTSHDDVTFLTGSATPNVIAETSSNILQNKSSTGFSAAVGGVPSFKPNMFAFDETELLHNDLASTTDAGQSDPKEGLREADLSVKLSNPWILAKLNARQKQRDNIYVNAESSTQPRVTLSNPDDIETLESTCSASGPVPESLPSPRPSSSVSNIGLSCSGHVTSRLPVSIPLTTPIPLSTNEVTAHSLERFRLSYGKSCQTAPTSTMDSQPTGTRLSDIPSSNERYMRKSQRIAHHCGIRKPFKVPTSSQPPKEKVWFDHLQGIKKPPRSYHPKPQKAHRNDDGLVVQGEQTQYCETQRLSPPANNHDIRTFANTFEPVVGSQTRDICKAQEVQSQTANVQSSAIHAEDNLSRPNKAILSGRTPLQPDENAAIEGHITSTKGLLTKRHCGPEKRTFLGGLSTNIQTLSSGQEVVEPRPRKKSVIEARRRNSAKLCRRTSTQLPLEQVTGNEQLQNVVQRSQASIQEISRQVESRGCPSFIRFRDTVIEPSSIFASHTLDLTQLTGQVHTLLSDPNFGCVDVDTQQLAYSIKLALQDTIQC